MHLEGKEFLSIWKAAHLWVGQDPDSTDPQALPDDVRDYIHLLIVGYMRGDLGLRGKRVYFDNSDDSLLNFVFTLPLLLKLRSCLIKKFFDKEFLNSLRIARGELLRWCQKEYRAPPPFWTPEILPGQMPQPDLVDGTEEDRDKSWYDKLTERRKQRVVTLDIAKRLWGIKPNQTYEEVRTHPVMYQHGYPRVFTSESFKDWTRSFASEYAKSGGKRDKSE